MLLTTPLAATESHGALNDRVYVDCGLSRLDFQSYPEVNGLAIEMLAVAEEDRGQGRARQAMEEICRWADRTGTFLYLTVSSEDPTVSVFRLEHFYQGFGFVKRDDLGDFTVRETRVRAPRIYQPMRLIVCGHLMRRS